MLPWEGVRHMHRLMLLYNVMLAQICILMLFWDTFVGFASSSAVRQFWAFTFDAASTLIVTLYCRATFAWATRSEFLADPSAYIRTDAMEPTLATRTKRAHIRRVEKSTGWELLFRQTAPVPWPGGRRALASVWEGGERDSVAVAMTSTCD